MTTIRIVVLCALLAIGMAGCAVWQAVRCVVPFSCIAQR